MAAMSWFLSASARSNACSQPAAFKGMSSMPWNLRARFQFVSPCLHTNTVVVDWSSPQSLASASLKKPRPRNPPKCPASFTLTSRHERPGPTTRVVMLAVPTALCNSTRMRAPWLTTATVPPGYAAAKSNKADSMRATASGPRSTPESGGKGVPVFVHADQKCGYRFLTSEEVRPCINPKFLSRNRSSFWNLAPAIPAMAAAV
mmetsp:Transcript_47015/g.130990  ORF Transcript_47015/g.130990 Transcript_47015/m.130990 type:complete len:203 (-) Transcript_47015:375-983(-)